jgi:heme b synthase
MTGVLSPVPDTLRIVAWEVTRRCNLACLHCRASSLRGPYQGELTTEECLRLLDDIASFSRPLIILTGGEPLLREDIYDIARYGSQKGMPMALATNGTLLTEDMVERMRHAGIRRVSVSIDGQDRESHDAFRGVAGAFDEALRGVDILRENGMEFQLNTTVTRQNIAQLEAMLDLSVRLGAAAHHIFLLVPTGRGKELSEQSLSPEDYEKTLAWFYEKSLTTPLQLKATCAPHYFRVARQKEREKGKEATPSSVQPVPPPPDGHPAGLHTATRGCMGGSSFCFISHTGQVQPCGYLEIDCGQIREKSFGEIWNHSSVFADLRDLHRYKGKCRRCPYLRSCGGCRARAFALTGDYLTQEPLCSYEPPEGRYAEERVD